MRKTKHRMFNQLLSIMLCVVLVLGYMPVSVSADTGIVYIDEYGETQTRESATEVTAESTAWGSAGTKSWYVVTGTVVIGSAESVSRVTATGDVHLILADDASLTVHGGIGLNGADSNITIYGQTAGTGALTVKDTTDYCAGIGASGETACGNITINGGQIITTGNNWGAGIGAGDNGACGDIEINGGELHATGGSNAAGVGSGSNATCGDIEINGGVLQVSGGYGASGIGSGCGYEVGSICGDITISDGEIYATGGDYAAGVGSGWNATCGDIYINGGELHATGNQWAAGVGSGWNATCGDIGINGGELHATGKQWAAGIGSGYYDASCGNITISGGTITATGGDSAAGIGTGYGGEANYCGNITISGGTITAIGGDSAVGIGSSSLSNCGDIIINGGKITARCNDTGSGIGKRFDSSSIGSFTLNADSVVYTSGVYIDVRNLQKGILFEGNTGTVYGNVTISDDFEVTEGQTLTIEENTVLTIGENGTLSNNGSIINLGSLINTGNFKNNSNFVNAGTFDKTNGSSITCSVHYEDNAPCTQPMRICELCGNDDWEEVIPHEVEYSADGNIITVNECTSTNASNCAYEGGILTLTAEDIVFSGSVYDGAEITTTNFPVAVTTADIVYYDSQGIKLSGKPFAAGTYTAKVTVGTATAEKSFVISKKARENIAVTVEDYVYGEMVSSTSLTSMAVENPSIEYYYNTTNSNTGGTSWKNLTGTTLEPGTYYAYAVLSESENYQAYTTPTTAFTVKTATANTNIKAENVTCTYDGKAHGITVTGSLPAGAVIRYGTEKGKYTLTESPVYTNVGTYTVYYQITARGYNPVEGSATITINKANRSDITVNMSGYTYNGTVSTPSLAGNAYENPSIAYYYNKTNSNTGGTKWQGVTGTTLEPGTYYMYAVVSATGNYNGYTTAATAFTVKNATASIKAENVTCTYDGKAHGITLTGTLPAGAVIRYGTEQGKYTLTESPVYTNAGTYMVYYQITARGYNTVEGSAKITIKIPKGMTFTSGKYKYKVTGSSTVAFTGIKSTSTTKVTIPKTVTYGGKTFKVTSIADNALKNKKKVTSVTVGANVTKIGKNAFYGCKKLKTITINSTKLKTVGSKAFKGINSKATIKVPTSKYSSYKKLFDGKGQGSKVSIVINPKKGDTFTSGNNKYKVTASSTVTFTGLKNTKKTTVSIPKTVKYGGKTFKVTAIADKALKGNTKVKKVTIGENVKTIGASAFYGCKNLKTITIKSTKLTSVGKNALKSINSKATIEVPQKKLSAYKKLLKNKGQGSKVTIVKINK